MSTSPSVIRRFVEYYAGLDAQPPAALATLYHPDATLSDPFGQHQGLFAIQRYFTHLLANVEQCRFTIDTPLCDGQRFAVTWTMHWSHPRIAGGETLALPGCSVVDIAGEQVLHQRDYYDAGEMICEHLPPAGLGGARREAEGALMMTVLITGASSGIGAGLAKSFAADGHLVIACGRDASRLAALQQLSPNISVRLFDMTDRDACRQARTGCFADLIILYRRDLRIPRPRTGGCRPRGAGDGHQLPRAGELPGGAADAAGGWRSGGAGQLHGALAALPARGSLWRLQGGADLVCQ